MANRAGTVPDIDAGQTYQCGKFETCQIGKPIAEATAALQLGEVISLSAVGFSGPSEKKLLHRVTSRKSNGSCKGDRLKITTGCTGAPTACHVRRKIGIAKK